MRIIVHNCALLWPFSVPFFREFSSQNDDNRRQLWTIVDKYLKPPFAKPTFRLPNCSLSWKVQMIMKNPWQNSQQNPQPNSHGSVGEIFTDFFCKVRYVRIFTPHAKTLQPPTMDSVCLQQTRFHANPATGTEPCKW